MDGAFVNWADAHVHVMTHSLHYGLAAFEGLRCYKGKSGSAIFRLQEHIDRLFESAHIGMMQMPFDKKQVAAAVVETVRVNNPIKLAIAAWTWGAYLGDDALANGMRARVSSYTRHHVNASMTRGKISGYYVNSILAKREAKADGYDEAILLDTEGYVSEGTGENIFIVRKGQIKTTPLTSILDGITRSSVIDLAREQHISVVEERFTRDDMYIADEVFVTGTAAELTPVREIDKRRIGTGTPGPITQALQKTFFSIVRGEDPSHEAWLTRRHAWACVRATGFLTSRFLKNLLPS